MAAAIHIFRRKMVLDKLIKYLDICRDEPSGTIAFEGVSLWEAIKIWGIMYLIIIVSIELIKHLKG